MTAALRISAGQPAEMGGDGVAGSPGWLSDPSPVPVDMSEEAYERALAYAGDASWQSILILRTDIMRSVFERVSCR